MNIHLHNIFKKITAVILVLILISLNTLQYASAIVDEYKVKELNSNHILSQENIDDNNKTSDDDNYEITEKNDTNKNN